MSTTHFSWLHVAVLLLSLVGAVNWVLVGAFNFDLVKALLKSMPMLEKAVYIIVGLSGLLCFIELMYYI